MAKESAGGQAAIPAHRPETDSRLTLAFKAILDWAQRRGGGIVTGAPFVFQIEIGSYASREDAARGRHEVLSKSFCALVDMVPQAVEPDSSWLPEGAVDASGLKLIHRDPNFGRRRVSSSSRDTSLDQPFIAIVYGLDTESGSQEYRLLFVFFPD